MCPVQLLVKQCLSYLQIIPKTSEIIQTLISHFAIKKKKTIEFRSIDLSYLSL